MTTRGAAVVAVLTRGLISACLLGGVLAMHALTADHDTTMVPMDSLASMVIAEHSAVSRPVAEVTEESYFGVDEQHMGEICVAVLAGSLAMLLWLFLLVWLRSGRSVPSLLKLPWGRLSRSVGRSPPWLTPSLSKLCVLRT